MARLSKVNEPVRQSTALPVEKPRIHESSDEESDRELVKIKRGPRRVVDSDDESDDEPVSSPLSSPLNATKGGLTAPRETPVADSLRDDSDSSDGSSDDSDIFSNSPLKKANRTRIVDSDSDASPVIGKTRDADTDDLEATLRELSVSAKTDNGPRGVEQASPTKSPTKKAPVVGQLSSSSAATINRPVDLSPLKKPQTSSNRPVDRSTDRPTDRPADRSVPRKAFNTSDPLRRPSGMLARLQSAQDERNRMLGRPGPPASPAKPTTTFGSPVRQFKASSGSLLEPVTPRSSQWQRKIDVSVLRDAKPVALGSPEKDLNASLLREPLRWGTKSDRPISRPPVVEKPTVTLIDGNVQAFISAEKVTEQLKDLLGTMDAAEKEEEITDEDKKVSGLEVTLLPHQVRGYRFLRRREKDDVAAKGGLLCDDMGLGKTVQSLALILGNPYNRKVAEEEQEREREEQENAKDKDKKAVLLPLPIKATLVVAPLALASQWAAEVRAKAPGLRVYVHHGPSRTKDASAFSAYDVVVTTYQIASTERAADGPLFKPHWWRVILDEAHTIKNRNSKSSVAAAGLMARRRWCLTGTPIQNTVDELYSLFRFIQLKPYDKYATWKGQIAGPIAGGRGKVAMQRLHAVLATVMLRRTKEVLKANGVNLPARRVHRTEIEFSQRERAFYDKLHRTFGQRIEKLVMEGGAAQYMSALLLLLRLRQTCDDMRLVAGRLDDDDKSAVVEASGPARRAPDAEADPDVDANANAGAVDDLADMLGSLDVNRELDDAADAVVSDTDPSATASAKIDKLVDLLSNEPTRKTIVFSQFTTMLDKIEPHLRDRGIRFARYDGSMPPAKRDASLDSLRHNPATTVLLCSLKCGALGLNLTCASRVVLVDPWWNPMITEQAIDRVHRLGQQHDVDVYELVVKKTVEEKILSLCDSKRALAAGVIDGASSSAVTNKLSKTELLDLFH